jgi:general secretion pathway protein B
LPHAVIALALLAIGIGIGWWRPWQAPRPNDVAAAAPTAANSIAPSPVVPRPEPAAVRSASVPAPPAKIEREAVVPKPAPAQSIAPVVAAPTPATQAVAKPAAAPVPTIVVAPPASSPVPTSAPAISPVDRATVDATGDAKTLNFADLPPAIRQEFPRMTISVHAYSSQPKNRLVTIDDHLLHEGDSAGAGITLEQITADGMIFSYKGYRFRRSVKDIVNSR